MNHLIFIIKIHLLFFNFLVILTEFLTIIESRGKIPDTNDPAAK